MRVARRADRLAARRTLVAVDGPDAAGKTTLADGIARHLRRPCIRASLDGFHRPIAERRARGELSPEGFYHDAFDLEALVAELLDPMAAGATEVCVQSYDIELEQQELRTVAVPNEAVLLVDGLFLLRPELRSHWDLSVHLHVSEQVTLSRARSRDAVRFGSEERVVHRYTHRFLPAQALYRYEADPFGAADVVLDNSEPSAPLVLRDPSRMLRAT